MKEPVNFMMNDGHVVIEYNGEFYDAETFGATDVEDIISGIAYDGEPVEIDVHSMAWYWSRCGTHRKQFRKILRTTCESVYNYAMGEGFMDDGSDCYDCECLTISDIPSWHL